MTHPLDHEATPGRLRALAGAGLLSDVALAQALARVSARPTSSSWAPYVRGHLAAIGVTLLGAGVVFFIAANWGELTPAVRMGLVAGALVGSAALSLHVGLERAGGRAAAMLSAVLVGPLLALYGQTYQTGADAWNLFAGWAGLALPLLVVVRSPGLWVGWLVLLHVTAALYADQMLERDWPLGMHLPVVALDAVALAAQEGFTRRTQARGAARAVAFILATLAGLLACVWLVDVPAGRRDERAGWVLTGFVVAVALLVAYRRVRHDLFMLTLGVAVLLAMLGTATCNIVLRALRFDLPGLFFCGLFIIAEVAVAAWWLRRWREPGDAP